MLAEKPIESKNPNTIKGMCTMMMMLYSLDFAEDNVHVSEGNALAINHTTVFAEFGPVLAMQILACSASVAVDGKTSK